MTEKRVHKAFHPAPYVLADVMALKALQAGTATKEQQVRALKWIVETCSDCYNLSYDPDSERDSAFAEGKRHVGLQIVKILNMDNEKVQKLKEKKQ